MKNCQFGVAECTYLRHVIRGGKVQVDKAKVEAVATMRVAILGDNTILLDSHSKKMHLLSVY